MIIGSFLNVCIYRIPEKQSIIFPASHCIDCKHKLSILDLFPIFSYIFLKGKCRYCNYNISIQYLMVEIINPLLYLLLVYKFCFTYEFFCYSFFTSFLVVIFVIDLNKKIIPNKIVFVGFIIILSIKILESFYYSSYNALLQSILGLITGMLPLFIIILISKGGMGAGDMKLMGVIGMWLGLKLTYLTLLIAIISAGILAIILILTKKKTRKSSIPFAPFLTTAAFISLIWGDNIFEFLY